MPFWMMQNLLVREGGHVTLKTLRKVPKAKSVRFQAHTAEFLDLLANMGPKFLLESVMRGYSGLVKGETILIEFAGDKCVAQPPLLRVARGAGADT